MDLHENMLKGLCSTYGDAFYLIDRERFIKNFHELKSAFARIYPKINIAYSYKTNYTPSFCKAVNDMGGMAEIVSDMELTLALRIGVAPENIIWNGPYKNAQKIQELLLLGGMVNIDSAYEVALVREIAHTYPHKVLNIGIRCNFDIEDGIISRFGFDTESADFQDALKLTRDIANVHLKGMHCHFATRRLDTWKTRAEKMLNLLDKLNIIPGFIDLGGGLFGKMPDFLKAQFDTKIPTYAEYADVVANLFSAHYASLAEEQKPTLLIEPGSALVGDCMLFASKVINIKHVRNKAIATLLGSIYNINPTLNTKNLPIRVYHLGGDVKTYDDLDFGGFTCIESDYLFRHYNGALAQGDVVVFENVGSYSVVLKPPFILPNFPILDVSGSNVTVIKRKEYFDDLFHTFQF